MRTFWKIKRKVIRRPQRKKAGRAKYLQCREAARELARRKIDYFNSFYGFKVNRIAIRDQKSRWGSCSKKGNLNFNYRIALLPERLADYVILHELCHLGEFNHSKRFWDLMEKAMPDARRLRQEFKKIPIL
jgi:predicted metal-dependent hydrolase